MRKEFIYSVAALAAFPIVANADNVIAASKIAVTAEKGAEVTLAKGKYIIKGTVTGKGTLTVGGKEVKLTDGEGKFTQTAQEKVTIAVTGDLKLADATIELDYNFAKVVELLNIEYNKVTQVLSVAQYKNSGDAQEYSKLYDRIAAIAGADYKFYLENKEGVQDVEDQTEVTGMELYTDIAAALEAVTGKEKCYQKTQLDELDKKFTDLGAPYNVGNKELDNAKAAAKKAVDAIDSTVDKIKAAQSAIKTYGDALNDAKEVKTVNETAYSELDKALTGVDTYYNTIKTQIDTQYKDARYAILKKELEDELAEKYKERSTFQNDIDDARAKKTVAANKATLSTKISEFKDGLTRIFSKYNTAKDKLAGAYDIYDTQKKEADQLNGEDFLASYKAAVVKAVDDLLTFIEGNNSLKNNTIANLTDEAIAAKVKAITDATSKHNAQKTIYNDYQALKSAVKAQTTALSDATTAIDKYAKDTKKLSIVPSTIWNTTVEAVTAQINTLKTNVDANKISADKYKTNKAYTDAQSKITSAINALKANANEATDLYATINGKIGDANKLLGELDKIKADLEALNVWKNQVTIDEAIKARTPYVDFIGDNGSVRKSISTWTDNLAAAVGKTAVLNDKKDNKDNILVYLKSLGTAADALKSEIQTMTDIKNNNQTDEEMFAEQIDMQEADGIRTLINGKAEVFKASIKVLQDNIDKKNVYGKTGDAKLQAEIGKINAKIKAAVDLAADKTAKKAALTEQYNNIKDLAEKDIKDAQDHAEQYAKDYKEFTNRYNTLNGDTKDAATATTVNGLKAKAKAEKETINGLKNLTGAQKTTLQGNVDGVKVTKKEDNKDVTYTIDSVDQFIKDAYENEKLTDALVSSYQTVINELKAAMEKVTKHATNLNTLEGDLNGVKFEDAKKAVLAKDPDTKSFYYLLLTDVNVTGSYLKAYNDQKDAIEKDADITDAEVTTYKAKITAIKANVDGAAAKAEANLNAYKLAQNAYSHPVAQNDKGGAVQRYEAAMAKLAKYETTELDKQRGVIITLMEKINELNKKAGESYYAGKAVADDYKTKIDAAIKELEDQVEVYTNEANYNAQVAADNKTVWEEVNAAHDEANEAYNTAAAIINSYKNLVSTELSEAANAANAEMEVLLAYLAQFDSDAAEIQDAADNKYRETVSPNKYVGTEYVNGFKALKDEINNLKKALSDKIKEVADVNVQNSIKVYTDAINTSKATVKDFTPEEGKELTGAQLASVFMEADALLKAITDAYKDADKLKELDDALVAAEKETDMEDTNGNKVIAIMLEIANAENSQALSALSTLRIQVKLRNLEGNDVKTYNTIDMAINSNKDLVKNFGTYKTQLLDLKVKSDNKDASNYVMGYINQAVSALSTLRGYCDVYAAGSQMNVSLKTIEDKITALKNTPVTTSNKDAQKKAAEDIVKTDIEEAYTNLYDKEVTVLEALVKKADEELVTYGGGDAAKKQAMKVRIDAQAKNLEDTKTAVNAAENPLPKKTALLNNLSSIETLLNQCINDMSDDSGTGLNANAYSALVKLVNDQKTALDNAVNAKLNGYTFDTSVLSTDYNTINAQIVALRSYLDQHETDMYAYQENAMAKLEVIKDAIADLKAKADQLQQAKEQADLTALNTTWKKIEDAIDTAQKTIEEMEGQLTAYGNGANYANKVEKLKEQKAEADDILKTAKEDADKKTTTADKQKIATETVTKVETALANLTGNCEDITKLAKDAYVDAAITKMQEELATVTWDPKNYTTTDLQLLKEAKDVIIGKIGGEKSDGKEVTEGSYASTAKALTDAKDKTVNKVTVKGVISTMTGYQAEFEKALNDLKKNIKDMSLVEDVKGQITEGDGTIDSGDLMALINIVLDPESNPDLNRCDINGDGKVNVTDVVWLRYFVVYGDWPTPTAAARGGFFGDSNNVKMKVVSNSNNVTRVAVNLNNDTEFNHFQFNLLLPAGAKVVGQSLGERVEGANLMMSQNEGIVRLLAISSANNVFAGNEGAVLYLDVENLNGNLTIEEAVFVGTDFNSYTLVGNGETTGIRGTVTNAIESAGETIYNLGGKVMNGLKKGINIIRRADGTTEKVVKK